MEGWGEKMENTYWIVIGLTSAIVIIVLVVFIRRSNGEVTGELTREKATFLARAKERGESKARVSGISIDRSEDTEMTAEGSGSEVTDISTKNSKGTRLKAKK